MNVGASLAAELRERLGDGGVLTGADASGRACDPFKSKPAGVDLVARPRTSDEVAFVLRTATRHRRRVVVHGGATGLSGGAWCDPGDIVLSLERMHRIESVSAVNRTIVAEAGVTLQALQEAADAADMLFPVDLGARGSATVGGMVATNAGGNRTLRWGMIRQRLLGLEAVLPDGTVISSMHRLVKNNTGYDLKHLFVGAEGTLGVVTRAVFKLVPKPTSHEVALVALSTYDSVLEALARAETLGALSAFELMYNDYYRAVTEETKGRPPLPNHHPYYLLIETMGYAPSSDRDAFESYLTQLIDAGHADDVVIAQSDAQRQGLWAVRESVDIAMRRFTPMLSYDVSLEVSQIDDYVRALRAALAVRFTSPQTIVLGHIGDNNIHVGISIGADTMDHEPAIDAMVYEPLASLSGAMSAEHGIGRTKKAYLRISRTEPEIELMRRIKNLIDPLETLNAEVLVPRAAAELIT